MPPESAAEPATESAAEPAHYNDLSEVQAEAWRLLVRGVGDRRSPFHTPAVATVRPDGTPAVRTVVLRGCRPAQRTLWFHTDARSGKPAELAHAGSVALLFYDPAAKVQLRVEGTAALHSGDAVAEEAWRLSRSQSRRCYRVPAPPGTPLADPAAAEAGMLDEPAAFAHFAVVMVAAARLEWLYLAHAGHRRARFAWTGDAWAGEWLVP